MGLFPVSPDLVAVISDWLSGGCGSGSGAGTAERRVLIDSSPFDDGCDELVLGQASPELVISPGKVGSCSGSTIASCDGRLAGILFSAHMEGVMMLPLRFLCDGEEGDIYHRSDHD